MLSPGSYWEDGRVCMNQSRPSLFLSFLLLAWRRVSLPMSYPSMSNSVWMVDGDGQWLAHEVGVCCVAEVFPHGP